jgi:RimJ/RimL family protein N-acetyltransferase/SAM-dependent methyltransferase
MSNPGCAEELVTARLSLRRPAPTDVDVIFSINSDQRACAHNPSDMLATRDEAHQLFRRWDQHWLRFGFGYWVVRRRDSAAPIGFCGIKVMQFRDGEAVNLFYRFDPAVWGNGLATEAASAVTGWAARNIPDRALTARIRPQNLASQRVAIHAGLTRAEHLDTLGEDGVDWIFVPAPRLQVREKGDGAEGDREPPAAFGIQRIIAGTSAGGRLRLIRMDPKTDELRAAHDVLSSFYRDRLADALDHTPEDRAVLGLFSELVRGAGLGPEVADIGCGTGRLDRYLAAQGLSPRGLDLSPVMIEVAKQDQPEFRYEVADLRQLPLADASQAGVVCWYSLIFLALADRPTAFAELGRVVKPGGYLVSAFKAGDGSLHRAGRSTGLDIEFDTYWLSPAEVECLAKEAGFATVFWGGVPPEKEGTSTQGYLIARKS